VLKYSDRADFISVYITEAHANDEWKMDYANPTVQYAQPKTLEERVKVAGDFMRRHDLAGSFAIDLMSNDAEEAYNAVPERLYIALDGQIQYAGAQGPFGYSIAEIEQWFEQNYSS